MSIKAKLQAARSGQKAAAQAARDQEAARASAPKAAPVQKKTDNGARARLEAAEAQAAEMAKKFDALKAQQEQLIATQTSAQRQLIAAERIKYAQRAGAKISGELLGRLLPDVDPGTAEGRQELERFRTSHPDIFRAPEPTIGDVIKGLSEKIDAGAKARGQKMELKDRKVFGEKLVRDTIERNLGGGK